MVEVSISKPESVKITEAQFKQAMVDPVYFVNEFCTTFDPRNSPYHFPFKLYPFQEDFIRTIVRHIEGERNLFTEKSRDMGVSWCILAVALWYWLFKPGSQILIGSRKEDLVDNFTVESLFGKIDYMMEKLPFTPEGYVPGRHRTRLKMVNPMNGNVIKGESSNAEFSRAGRYKFIIPDEFAFWENADTAWSAMGESSPCILPVTTPAKKPHFSKALRNSGLVEVYTLHWRLHPLKDETWYEEQKKEKFAEDIARELDINWEGSITGRVYPEIAHIRLGDFPYMDNWPLYVSHDFGHSPDPHSIGWFQVNPENGRIRLIESVERSGKIIDWFMPFFGFPIDSKFSYTNQELEIIAKVSEWKKATHYGDPAGRSRNEQTGRSVIQRMSDFEIYVNTNTKANDLETRKTEARMLMMRMDIHETPNNKYFLECIKNARYPDRSENGSYTTENSKPIHDWTSHNRTMFEYFAVNFEYTRKAYEPAGLTFDKAMASVRARSNKKYFIGNE